MPNITGRAESRTFKFRNSLQQLGRGVETGGDKLFAFEKRSPERGTCGAGAQSCYELDTRCEVSPASFRICVF